MIAKIFPLSLALVAAASGTAAAHDADGCDGNRQPATYNAPAPVAPMYTPVGYGGRGGPHPDARPVPQTDYRGDGHAVEQREELRRSDLNRDGRVTLAEALQQSRREFWREDRDHNRALSAREASWGDFAREDRDRNGWISLGEYQDAARRSFYRMDTNGDGVLARYELWQNAPRGPGWRR